MRRILPLVLTLWALAGAAAAQGSWPQSVSDVRADPRARFGVLANGMRYVVMPNATPAGQTALRLRIGSGSMEESDSEQGLAHVLEHMAFKGSTHVPAGEMIRILQRNGLAFGPDTNAQTGWTQTVYMLDLPRSDPALLGTGLMLLRETAGELTIDPKALDSERGVVLSEERLRDTPEYRAEKAQINLLADGQLVTRRYPIGQVDIVRNAPADLVRQFYRANYRPDRATVIAVGDFDPAAMEALIRARFSDWKAVGPETAAPDLGQVEKRGLTVKVVDLPGAQTLTQIAWARPYDNSPDSLAKRRRETVETLALLVLNRRLARLAQEANPPFMAADGAFDNLLHSDKVAVVEATSAPDAWRPALAAIDQEVRRLTRYGVARAELDREVAQWRAALVNAQSGEATRPTPEMANAIVEAADANNVFTAPAEDLAVFDAAVKNLTPAEVDSAARAIFAGAGPLVELETPAAPAGGEQAVKAQFAKADAAPVAAPTAQAQLAWPYASFGKPGTVVSRKDVADLGVTEVHFANGVALIVKPTAFRKDQVLVGVEIGHGRADEPTGKLTAAWAGHALIDGGFKAIDLDDSQAALAGRIYSAEFTVEDAAWRLHGVTRPADFATQLQVLAAYVADPGFRPEAFEQTRQAWLSFLPQLAATPDGVFNRDFEHLVHDGDERWATPGAAAVTAAGVGDLRELLAGPLAHGSLEVTVVGDVSVDAAIAQVAATFGALPRRGPPADPRLTPARFPAPGAMPVVLNDAGRPDQAIAAVAWPLTDFYADPFGSRAAMLAGAVLENRVIDKVRISEGATYSPEVQTALSETFPGYGLAFAEVEIPPEKIGGFFADVNQITTDMAAKGVSADELERARNPRVATIRKAQFTNEYWLGRLEGSIADPRRLMIIRSTFPDYARVTAADVQAAARRWFEPATAWRLEIKAMTPVAMADPRPGAPTPER
jgi:zinc protease